MAISTTQNRIAYVGNGATTTFQFPYQFNQQSDLKVFLFDTILGGITQLTLNTDYTITGTTNSQGMYLAGGQINLTSIIPLATSYLGIVRVPAFINNYVLFQSGSISSTALVQQIDALTLLIQRLEDQVSRGITLPDGYAGALNLAFPVPLTANIGQALILDPTGAKLVFGATGAGGSTGSIPAGGDIASVLTKHSTTDYDATWVDYAYSGFSARFGAAFSSVSLDDTLRQILNISYSAPTISFSASGSGSVYEYGASIASTVLTAIVTKRSDPITTVVYKVNGTTVATHTNTITGGGTDTYTYSTAITAPTTVSATATDSGATGGPTPVTGSASFVFVYPYYYGPGAVGLTAAQVGALTKNVMASNANFTNTFTATAGQVFYFAYPASYPALTSILDVNNFETLSDWNATTGNITGLDGTIQSYKIYAFKNAVSAGSYQYTFKGS